MPLWLWDVGEVRIVWANQACLDFSGALSVDDLIRLKFNPEAPFIKQLQHLSLLENKPEGIRELIRFPTKNGEFVFDCLCRVMDIEPGRAGVLVGLVDDKGKVIPEPDKQMKNGEDKEHANGIAKELSNLSQEGLQENAPEDSPPVQVLCFDVGHDANGFQIESGKVDEEDLRTLQEIARMINGSSGLGLAGSTAGEEGTGDRRPLVTTRSPEIAAIKTVDDKAAPEDDRVVLSAQFGKSSDELSAQNKNGSAPIPKETVVPLAPRSLKKAPKPEDGERNYFLESLPAALAIAMGGRLMRANEAFLYAFGFGSESDLRKNGGLAALFPESQDGVLVSDQPVANTVTSTRKAGRSARVTALAISRSGRKRRIPIAFRNVSTGREPVQIMILHEDALWQDEELDRGEDLWREENQGQLNGLDQSELAGVGKVGQDRIDFLASVSHEVRTPLNSIIGFSELMKDERFGAVDADRFRDYAGDIHASAMHALSLINDLLDITKIMAGKSDLDFESIKINDVIHDAMSTMRTQATRRKISLHTSLQEGLPALYADPRSLKQILLNLVSNAIKFTSAGGEVIVSTHLEADGGVRLVIKDTGIGMHKDQISTALEPFSQLDRVPDEMSGSFPALEKGTGLGLPLTKALVKAHHANFSIDSAPGQGTSIEITFPPEQLAD